MSLPVLQLRNQLYTASSFVKQARLERFQAFLRLVKPPSGARIVDLGGTVIFWKQFDHDFDITIVNLPGTMTDSDKASGYRIVEADAADLTHIFVDKSFDVVFSNSVIEHVGDRKKQFAFAREVNRLAKAYWVQTPSSRFPVEAHTGILFYWQLPASVRQRLMDSWAKQVPA